MFGFLREAFGRSDREESTVSGKTKKIGEYTVQLTSAFGEYNCGNKTCGRLELTCKDKEGINQGGGIIADELKKVSVRDEIIQQFLDSLTLLGTFKPLNKGGGQAFFPSDSGIYPPGILIYADRIHMNQSYTWWNNWKGLLEVFESEEKFGVVVLKSPILPNKYYGTSAPSRVWTIVLPAISKHVCFDKKHVSPEMASSLKTIMNAYGSPALIKEIKSLGVSANGC